MAVYFERGGPSWWDYVMPVVGQALGGMINQGFEKNREIRAAKQAQESADADFARKRQQSEWLLGQLGYAPGTLDMRGNPNAAMAQIAAIKSLVPDFDTTGTLNNINPNMQRNVTDLGDRARVDVFNPGNGDISGQEFSYGTNPTKKYESDKHLEGVRYNTDGSVRIAGIHEAGANSRTAANLAHDRNKPRATEVMPDAQGNLHFIDPYARTTAPVGIQGPTPKQAQGPSLKDMGSILGAFIDPTTGRPIPGYEGFVDELGKQVMGVLGGKGVTPGNQLPPQPSEVPMASANPFKGVLDDGTFQRAIASGKSVEDIRAELIRLGRLGKK